MATYCLGNFDGIDGVFEKPFDMLAEYSIAWNIYLDLSQIGSNAISEITFSVLKSIPLAEPKTASKWYPQLNSM